MSTVHTNIDENKGQKRGGHNLALASVAVIKPLKETILMHKLDAPATRAWIPEGILGVARVPAYPAHVLFLLVIVVVLCRRRRRRR